MADQLILRLFRCRPVRVEFDAVLRDRLIPGIARLPGVVAVHVGRHGPDALGERLVASVWRSAADLAASGRDAEAAGFDPGRSDDAIDRSVEVLPLAIAVRTDRPDPERVMRLVKGRVRNAGELDAYVEEARSGTLQDASTDRGPIALYLAALPPDEFVTLSVWAEWASIEASTGAGTAMPATTRHAQRLVELDVTHYEIVPR